MFLRDRLCVQLTKKLQAAPGGARVVAVSSSAHKMGYAGGVRGLFTEHFAVAINVRTRAIITTTRFPGTSLRDCLWCNCRMRASTRRGQRTVSPSSVISSWHQSWRDGWKERKSTSTPSVSTHPTYTTMRFQLIEQNRPIFRSILELFLTD